MERLTGLDATFLYLETPTHHMHVAMTMVLDPSSMEDGYSFEHMRDFIASRLDRVPPLRRRLVPVPLNLHHPVWVDDPHFDISHHVRRTTAPTPGGRRELGQVAAQIASTPLDRGRPLWEMWLVEGLRHGRVGVVSKVHHSVIDGASGADLMVHLFDLDAASGSEPLVPADLPSERIPSDVELVGYAIRSRVQRMAGLGPLLTETVRSINRVAQGRRAPEGLVGAVPLTAPRVPWNGPTSGRRDVGLARVPLPAVKAVKEAFGCTVNDVVLALCAGTLRRYLQSHDALPDQDLVAVCPVSVRPAGDSDATNKVSAMFTSLAVHQGDVEARLQAIRTTTRGAKEEHNAVGASMLQNWAEFAGPNVFNLASRLYSGMNLANVHRPVHNIIVSNVPGPPFPLYFGGAEVVAAYPLGPVMEGCGLNVTVFSYQDWIDVGFMVDAELVPDVWDMAASVAPALRELLEAAGLDADALLGDAPPTSGAASDAGPAVAETTTREKAAAPKKAAARKRATPKKRRAAATRAPATSKATPKKQKAAATKKAASKKKAAPTKKAATKKAPAEKKTPAKKKAAAEKKTPARKKRPAKKAASIRSGAGAPRRSAVS